MADQQTYKWISESTRESTEKMSDWLQHIINQLEHVWKDLFFQEKGKQLTGGRKNGR